MSKLFITKGKGYRVENGHPWVYNNEIEKTEGELADGDIADVLNYKGTFIGRGYYNSKSQILLRILTRKGDKINEQFFEERIKQAYDYRKKIGYKDNYRLVFGEADFLPALIIDKFGDYFVVQTQSLGIDKWKKEIVNCIDKIFSPKGIYERNDVPVRALEGLEEIKGFLSSPFDTKITINELGVKLKFDVAEGQKTGFFLDQKENRLELENIAKDAEVLDCFTYTGSFALFAAHFGARKVTGYDISEWAVQQATENAALNNFTQCEFRCANAFDALPELIKEKKLYDVVILDPPAFTKSRTAIDAASRGYKEINLRGMKLVKPGGFLLSFSCSHFISEEIFYKTLLDAAMDAGKTIRQVKYLQQAKDHPIVWNIAETNYLKGYLMQVI